MGDNETAVAIVALLSISISAITVMRMWLSHRKAARDAGPPAKQIDDRLGRIEQAIDAMSIEVERISEGQRFTTKVLTERAKEPVPIIAPRERGG